MKKSITEIIKAEIGAEDIKNKEYKALRSEVEDLCRNGYFPSFEKKGVIWYIDEAELREYLDKKWEKNRRLDEAFRASQMMNRCPSCDARVSKQAFTCPSCGNPLRFGVARAGAGCLLWFIILLVIGFLFFGLISLGL